MNYNNHVDNSQLLGRSGRPASAYPIGIDENDVPHQPIMDSASLPHPSTIAPYEATWTPDTLVERERQSAIVQAESHIVRGNEIHTPRFAVLHDKLRTRDAWEKCVNAYANVALTVPAAGASASTLVTPTQLDPVLPGNPGKVLAYAYINSFSAAAQGTTLTGYWWVELLVNNQTIPLGMFSGLGAFNNSVGLLGTIPFDGARDDKTPLGQLRVSIETGATVSAVTMRGLLTLSYVYKLVEDAPRVRRGAGYQDTDTSHATVVKAS